MITFDEIEQIQQGKQLLEDKKAEEKAHSILNSELLAREEEVEGMESNNAMPTSFEPLASPAGDQAMMEGQQGETPPQEHIDQVATEAIQMMEQAEANGQDPMAILGQLPPQVQERIAQMLDGGVEQQGQAPQQQQDPMQDVLTQAAALTTPQGQ